MQSKSFKQWGAVGALAVVGILVLGSVAKARQSSYGALICVNNIDRWRQAINIYAQDYDERYPVFESDAQIESVVGLYHHHYFDNRPMRSPVNGSFYRFNPELSGGYSSDPRRDLDTVPVLTESVASFDGVPFVAALDGRVYQGRLPVDDPTRAIARKARDLTLGLLMYVQDYDETLPPKMDNASLKVTLSPYLRTSRSFSVSPKGGEFVFNSALGGKMIWQFPNTTIVLQTPFSPSIFPSIYGTLAGKVYIKGKEYVPPLDLRMGQPELDYAKQLGTAVILYAQDHDETYPNTADLATFKAQILPYLSSAIYLQTPSGKDYILNATLSGVAIASLEDVSGTELFRSSELLFTGKRMIGFADGHVRGVR